MLHSTPAWRGKDAPVVMAGTCKAGVGFSSSLSHQHLVHRPLHLTDLPLHPPDAAVPSFPAPSDGCKAPPGTLLWTSIHLPNAWRTAERNTYPREEMPGHTVPRCEGKGDGHATRHQKRRAPIPPLAKDSRAVPLCSGVPPPSLPRSQPAPLRASPPPFCAILVSISRFSDSLSSPSNKVTLQSHRHSAPTLRALSRTQLFKRLHCSSEPANYSLSPKYRPENTEFRSRGNNVPLVRNHRLGESQKAVSVLGLYIEMKRKKKKPHLALVLISF